MAKYQSVVFNSVISQHTLTSDEGESAVSLIDGSEKRLNLAFNYRWDIKVIPLLVDDRCALIHSYHCLTWVDLESGEITDNFEIEKLEADKRTFTRHHDCCQLLPVTDDVAKTGNSAETVTSQQKLNGLPDCKENEVITVTEYFSVVDAWSHDRKILCAAQ